MRTFILLGLVLASPSLAQTWSRIYPTPGDDVLWKAVEAADGTLVVSGYSATEGSLLTRLQADGAVIWSVSLPLSAGILRDHTIAANGDILACGHHSWGGALALRLDPSGAILWQSELPWEYWGGEDSVNNAFTAVTEAANGDVLLAGQSVHNRCEDPTQLHFRLDPAGAKLWGYYGNYGWLTDVLELPDQSVAYLGASYWYGVSYMRVAADGHALNERLLEPLGGARAKVSLAADGNLFVVPGCFACDYYYWRNVQLEGSYEPQEPFEVTKLDPFGNVLWRKAYGAAPDVAIDVVATPDGGAVVLGETFALGGDRDLRLTRLDAQGAIVWQRAYGGPGNENATGLTSLADGGFLLAGRTDAGGGAGHDGLLLRVDSAGEVAGCPTTVTWRSEQQLVGSSTVFGPGEWIKDDALAPTLLVIAPLALLPEDHCLGLPPVGSIYCAPAVANSSGVAAQVHALGSTLLTDNDLTLVGTDLPVATFGYFVAGTGNGQVIPPGAEGRLCLTGSTIHRYAQAVLTSDADGSISLAIDVTQVPGYGSILTGETWNFQAWFRDHNPTPTSNFTDAVSVLFL